MARERLMVERKIWRQNHPALFYCRPLKNPDKSTNIMIWEAGIPGETGTPWEGGMYKLNLKFSESFPQEPPMPCFVPVIFHPNVFPSGTITSVPEFCNWESSKHLASLLLGIQRVLSCPDLLGAASKEPYEMYKNDRESYNLRIRQEARKYKI